MKANEKDYQVIEYQVGTYDNIPVMVAMSIEEQIEIEKLDNVTVSDVIEMNIANYRDWQSEC